MIISAHQPAFLPWAGYLHRIALSDIFIILDSVQFEKNSFINRNRVKGANGPIWLTVPVSLKGHIEGTIKTTAISYEDNWRQKHLKTLKHNYNSSAYFKLHVEFFEYVYNNTWENIADINKVILNYFIKQLKITTPIKELSTLNIKGTKQDLIISVCKHFNADSFIFGTQGRDYVDKEYFKQNNVVPKFHSYNTPIYPQKKGEFIPNLSFLDMLFNVPNDELMQYLVQGGIVENE